MRIFWKLKFGDFVLISRRFHHVRVELDTRRPLVPRFNFVREGRLGI